MTQRVAMPRASAPVGARTVAQAAAPARAFALLAAAFAVIVCVGLGVTAARASAVFRELTETGAPGVLVLSLDSASPLWAELGPGERMHWLVEASLRDADRGDLSLELQASGDLITASGISAGVEACTGTFDLGGREPVCDGTRSTVLAATALHRIAERSELLELAPLLSDEPRQLLVSVAIPQADDAAAISGRTAHVGLGVHVAGDSGPRPPAPPSPPRLPVTGSDAGALAILAVGLLGLGASLALRRRAAFEREAG